MEHDLLKHPTVPMDVRERSIAEVLEAMEHTGFQGRKLGEAVSVWKAMMGEDDITIFLGLTGAMVPAGMRRIISYMVKNRMIDCLVSTGANIFHDIHEAMGGYHYKGHHAADDGELYKCGIDRMYDVFAREEEFRNTDRMVSEFTRTLDLSKEYSSREICQLLGEFVKEKGGDEDSIIVSALEAGVPIFVPSLGDSSIGIGLTLARREGRSVMVSYIKDVDEITSMVEKGGKTGVIYVGGGVPKNFIQQTEVIASLLGTEKGGHDYGIQFTTDAPHWGGLTGSTFEEAISWGKYSTATKRVQVFVDATIALPLVTHALHDQGLKRKNPPEFTWKEV